MSNTDRWSLLRRGLVGWCADAATPDGNKVSSRGGTLEHYVLECPDGTPVYDAKDADKDRFADFIVGGPMSDASLKPGEVHRFNDHAALASMIPGLAGAFKVLGAMALLEGDKKLGSFDYVSVDLYLDMLRAAVPGVKFGKVYNNEVQWEE